MVTHRGGFGMATPIQGLPGNFGKRTPATPACIVPGCGGCYEGGMGKLPTSNLQCLFLHEAAQILKLGADLIEGQPIFRPSRHIGNGVEGGLAVQFTTPLPINKTL